MNNSPGVKPLVNILFASVGWAALAYNYADLAVAVMVAWTVFWTTTSLGWVAAVK